MTKPASPPQTEADRRFRQLRTSGYTGPIDQDGNAVTDPQTLGILTALNETNASK